MPNIKINDMSMYYESHGKGEPIVFVAGFGADHLGWASVLNAFASDYQVILLDNRGVGQTDVPAGPYTIAQMAKDVATLCAVLNITNAHFIGNSMGGYIVQTLAHHFPALVKSVVISNSGMGIKSPFRIYVQAQLELMKAHAPVESIMKAMCSWVFSYDFLMRGDTLSTLIEWGKNNPFPFTIAGHEAQYAALVEFNSSAWVKDIRAPTLVVTGDQDIVLRPDLSKALAAEIKQAHYHVFHRCGHLPHIEYPADYAKVVKAFLKGVSSGAQIG